MPKERFLNLPEEKRRRVCQAAYEELSRVPYDELSINQIIRKAGIPRGSFYQYFQDKEDLIAYLMEGFRDCFMKFVTKAMQESRGDIFYVHWKVLNEMIAFGEQKENYRILKNVFSGLRVAEIKSFEVFWNIGDVRQTFIQEVYGMVDHNIFKTDTIEDFEEILELLSVIARNAAVEIFADITRKEEILNKVETRLEMIKYGVLKKEENDSNVKV